MHLRLLAALCNDLLEVSGLRAKINERSDQSGALQTERRMKLIEVRVLIQGIAEDCVMNPVQEPKPVALLTLEPADIAVHTPSPECKNQELSELQAGLRRS